MRGFDISTVRLFVSRVACVLIPIVVGCVEPEPVPRDASSDDSGDGVAQDADAERDVPVVDVEPAIDVERDAEPDDAPDSDARSDVEPEPDADTSPAEDADPEVDVEQDTGPPPPLCHPGDTRCWRGHIEECVENDARNAWRLRESCDLSVGIACAMNEDGVPACSCQGVSSLCVDEETGVGCHPEGSGGWTMGEFACADIDPDWKCLSARWGLPSRGGCGPTAAPECEGRELGRRYCAQEEGSDQDDILVCSEDPSGFAVGYWEGCESGTTWAACYDGGCFENKCIAGFGCGWHEPRERPFDAWLYGDCNEDIFDPYCRWWLYAEWCRFGTDTATGVGCAEASPCEPGAPSWCDEEVIWRCEPAEGFTEGEGSGAGDVPHVWTPWGCDAPNIDCASTPGCMATSSGCGNGFVERGEECDDGNLEFGDGCTWGCLVESGNDCFEVAGRSYCGTPIRGLGELTFTTRRHHLISYGLETFEGAAMCTGGSTWLINRMDHAVYVRPRGYETALGDGDLPRYFVYHASVRLLPGAAVRVFNCDWVKMTHGDPYLPRYTRDGPPEDIAFEVEVYIRP